jgi:hypothetical protein
MAGVAMTKKPNTIFCDEAGFTGNNLLDPSSQHFVFATVNVSHETATSLVRETIKRYRLQGNELKGSNLIKHSVGRKAIDFLHNACGADSKVVFFNKPYAIAGKFYEWTFDEIFGNHNTFFYVADFHRFISNAIYLGMITGDPLAKAAVTDFQALMRGKDDSVASKKIFSFDSPGLTVTSLIETAILFCQLNKEKILRELHPLLSDPDNHKWMLELSNTALPGLLSAWGEEHESLEVYCDASKPINDQLESFNCMVGQTKKIYMTLGKITWSLTYNLASPIKLVDSKQYPGIQIADVFASSLCYALNNQDDQFCKDLIEKFGPAISECSVVPDLDYVDLSIETGFVNSVLLQELVDRQLRGKYLYDGLPEIRMAARQVFPQFRASIGEELIHAEVNQ